MFAKYANREVEPLEYKLVVAILIGDLLLAGNVYKGNVVKVCEHELKVDLIPLEIHDFDVILGIDWLANHRATVDCFLKEVIFRKPGEAKFIFFGERRVLPFCVIYAMTTRRLLHNSV
ncbi:hypothetical protein Pint_29127 [Pistacia integerrima]|uniref:Uncharacterized protein n=1 Tax=Pistacia integerrima TaxID=434235 RepID=A0ACC0X1B4_9ROSI|nr:hypothetical protein Pint_29127 [Pistacia integerrima]